MPDLISLLEEPDTSVAVVGATDSPSKFGNIIYRDLKTKGFQVYAVNPNRDVVDGDQAFSRLEDLPSRPTIVNLVVPPEVSLDILEQCARLGLKNVWVQPGAHSQQTNSFLQSRGFNYLSGDCIMVLSRSKV